MTAATTATAHGAARVRTDWFQVSMAGLIVLIAFGGFAGTYWLQVAAGTFTGSGLVHLHGVLFSAWTLLLFSQAWLGARRSLAAHRAWGVVGVSLATAMVVIGVATTLASIRAADLAGWGDGARMISLTSLSALAVFASFVVAGMLNVRRPEWHKRLMLLSSYSIIGAALARIVFHLQGGGGPGVRLGNLPSPATTSLGFELTGEAVGLVLCLVGMAYDWRTRGRPHPAWAIGVVVLVAVAVLRTWVGPSPEWRAAVNAVMRFLG